jgi:glycosyltransferase involved in cell wall biosynthesis
MTTRRAMRITIVSGFFLPVPPVAGGAMEKIWWRLAREFAARGHSVTHLSRHWPGCPDEEQREGVRVRRIRGFDHRRHLTINLLLDAWWGWRVQSRLPAADILITNTIALPIWIRRRRPEAGQLVVNLNRFPKGQLRWYHDVARIQAASPAIARAAAAQAPQWREVLRVTPNPIDLPRLSAAATARKQTGDALVIGYQGRLHPEKGVPTLLAAATRLLAQPDLPPWRLVLRGPTDIPRGGGGEGFGRWLDQQAAALQAAGRYVRHPPENDEAQLAREYAALDVFCYPTQAESGEALPVAVLEAMAAGRAVIVSDLDCFRELVLPETTGLVLSDARGKTAPERLAGLLSRLLRDSPLRERLGTAAQTAVKPLDYSVVAEAMLADFSSLLHAAS